MIAARTSARSGQTTRSRSVSVLDGAICSSGTSSPVVGQPVLDQAVVGELEQFLDPDAGGAQHLDDRPGPERVVFFAGQVVPRAGCRVAGPDSRPVAWCGDGRIRVCPAAVNAAPGGAAQRGCQRARRVGRAAGDGADQDRQDGQALAGAGVHPGLAVPVCPCAVRSPRRRPGREPPTGPSGRGPRRPTGPGQGRRRGRVRHAGDAAGGDRFSSAAPVPSAWVRMPLFPRGGDAGGRCRLAMPGWWRSRSAQKLRARCWARVSRLR